MGSIEILEDVSFRVTLKNWGSKWQCHFVDSDLKVEKEGKTEYGELILKWRFKYLLRTSAQGSGKF